MLLLFFLDPKRPCMKIIGACFGFAPFAGSWRSNVSETLDTEEYLLKNPELFRIKAESSNRGGILWGLKAAAPLELQPPRRIVRSM